MFTLALLATIGCNAPTDADDMIDPIDTAADADTAPDTDDTDDTDTAPDTEDTDTAPEDTDTADTDTVEDTDTGELDTDTAEDTDTGPTEDPAPPCVAREDGTGAAGFNMDDEIVLYADPADGAQTYVDRSVRGCGGSLRITCTTGVTATISASIVTADTAPLELTITYDGADTPTRNECWIFGSYTNAAGLVDDMGDVVVVWVL
jgi:hypothetical protein